MQNKRLSDHFSDVVLRSIDNTIEQTLAYGVGYLFELTAVTAIGSWSAFMGATFAGSFALFIPLILIHTTMEKCGLLTPLTHDILKLAYKIGAPIVGAVLLNWLFAWTLPLMPVVICAAIGGAISLVLESCFRSSSQNRQDSENIETVRRLQEASVFGNRGHRRGASVYPRGPASSGIPMSMLIFADDIIDKDHPLLRTANVSTNNSFTRTRQQGSAPIVEELGDDGRYRRI